MKLTELVDAINRMKVQTGSIVCSRRVLDIAKNKDGIAGVGMLLKFDGDTQFFTQVKENDDG